MNRRERRRMSKRLGIMKYQKNLPRNKRFELIKENIISGKQQHNEFLENNRIQQNRTAEEVEADAIEFMSQYIAESQKIPLVDAIKIAQEKYKKHNG